MKTQVRSNPHTRSTAAALELVQRLEADLREIRYRLSEQAEAGEKWISLEDNQDLNVIRKEVGLFLDSLSEATA